MSATWNGVLRGLIFGAMMGLVFFAGYEQGFQIGYSGAATARASALVDRPSGCPAMDKPGAYCHDPRLDRYQHTGTTKDGGIYSYGPAATCDCITGKPLPIETSPAKAHCAGSARILDEHNHEVRLGCVEMEPDKMEPSEIIVR